MASALRIGSPLGWMASCAVLGVATAVGSGLVMALVASGLDWAFGITLAGGLPKVGVPCGVAGLAFPLVLLAAHRLRLGGRLAWLGLVLAGAFVGASPGLWALLTQPWPTQASLIDLRPLVIVFGAAVGAVQAAWLAPVYVLRLSRRQTTLPVVATGAALSPLSVGIAYGLLWCGARLAL